MSRPAGVTPPARAREAAATPPRASHRCMRARLVNSAPVRSTSAPPSRSLGATARETARLPREGTVEPGTATHANTQPVDPDRDDDTRGAETRASTTMTTPQRNPRRFSLFRPNCRVSPRVPRAPHRRNALPPARPRARSPSTPSNPAKPLAHTPAVPASLAADRATLRQPPLASPRCSSFSLFLPLSTSQSPPFCPSSSPPLHTRPVPPPTTSCAGP